LAKSTKPPRGNRNAPASDDPSDPKFVVPEAEITDAEINEDAKSDDGDASIAAEAAPDDTPETGADDAATTPEASAGSTPPKAEPDVEEPVTEPDRREADQVDEPADTRPDPTVDAEPPRRGGFAGGLFGGLLAGVIGFGVATYLFRDAAPDPTPDIAANRTAIDTLRSDLDALPPVPDLSALRDEVGAIDGRLTDLSDTLQSENEQTETRLADLDQRLSDLEKAPNADGTLSDQAMAAYQRDLDTLRAEIDAQQDQMAALAADAETALAGAEAEAQAIEQAARDAAARATLARLRAALDTGEPFASLIPDLGDLGADLPAALTSVADAGVPTVQELSSSFPDAARAALAAARAEDGASGGVGAFLRDRFEVRSTVPRDGDDPDAVLSRAEAAVRDGRLSDALAEVETLPEAARAAMTDWLAEAEARRNAVAAVDTLMQSVSDN